MIRKNQLTIDYHQKFGDEQGDRLLKDLRRVSHFDAPLTSGNPITLAIKVGEANIIKHIYKKLKKDPNAPERSTAINRTGE